jgi:glutamate-ammonia-ligase adenylyltransferase
MASTDTFQDALAKAWHQDVATSSLERWLALSEKNQWGRCPKNQDLLISLFGASWYFTRFVFFRGREIADIFDEPRTLDFTSASLLDDFMKMSPGTDQETQFEILKIRKNEIMLAILLAQLSGSHRQEEIESALTSLAEASLSCAIQILAADDVEITDNIAILSMGRMAGDEMNFGSDLDLIFLYPGGSQDLAYKISSFVRKLMRIIGLLSPAGLLYEVDMRLRPHGNSGLLVTGTQSFVDYHKGEREIWERQMMTRCRAVVDNGKIASSALAKIESSIYQKFDKKTLRAEIIEMRKLVVDELGSKQGTYDIKRGEGGIMDIDFLTHYLQLLHGHEDTSLRTSSTRTALRKLSAAGNIDNAVSKFLLEAYDYLKTIENHVRVFDMKSISTFPKDISKSVGLLRSMNYQDDNIENAAGQFMDDYRNMTQKTRNIFNEIFSLG